jgi:hypothetical protein
MYSLSYYLLIVFCLLKVDAGCVRFIIVVKSAGWLSCLVGVLSFPKRFFKIMASSYVSNMVLMSGPRASSRLKLSAVASKRRLR